MFKNTTFYSALLLTLGFAASLLFSLANQQIIVWQLSSLPLSILFGLVSFIGTLVLFSLTKTNSKAELVTRIGMIVLNLFLIIYVIGLMITVDTEVKREILTSVGEENIVEFYEYSPSFYEEPTTIYAQLQGPLWFSKLVYEGPYTDEINVEWLSPTTLLVNGDSIEL